MAATSTLPPILLLLAVCVWAAAAVADDGSMQLMTDGAVEWPSAALYSFGGEEDDIDDSIDDGDMMFDSDPELGSATRRSLFWRRHRIRPYFISYSALSANRIPCPPRSGRSYYTHNCYRARGPVHPYTRGCSAITQCRR